MKAIVGAVLIDGAGGPPVSDSVVAVAGGVIQMAGPRGGNPLPAEADKIDGSGQYIVPGLIDVYPLAGAPPSMTTPEEARARVAELAARKAPALHVGMLAPAVAQAAGEAARQAGLAVVGHVSTEAGVKLLVANGASSFVGMIADRDDLDPALVARLRDLRIVFAPALASFGAAGELAGRNTHRLFAAGVPIAVASAGGDFYRETQLLVAAGIPPLDVIVAATSHGAMALHQLDQRGTVQPGKRADLLLLSANPGEDIRNLVPARRMTAGEWQR
ncbi:MAG: amidohydrolase family protein [Acidobacteriia bacterium]|nr:amidohydrolase family protein [Terriglobia bacterium]